MILQLSAQQVVNQRGHVSDGHLADVGVAVAAVAVDLHGIHQLEVLFKK